MEKFFYDAYFREERESKVNGSLKKVPWKIMKREEGLEKVKNSGKNFYAELPAPIWHFGGRVT